MRGNEIPIIFLFARHDSFQKCVGGWIVMQRHDTQYLPVLLAIFTHQGVVAQKWDWAKIWSENKFRRSNVCLKFVWIEWVTGERFAVVFLQLWPTQKPVASSPAKAIESRPKVETTLSWVLCVQWITDDLDTRIMGNIVWTWSKSFYKNILIFYQLNVLNLNIKPSPIYIVPFEINTMTPFEKDQQYCVTFVNPNLYYNKIQYSLIRRKILRFSFCSFLIAGSVH